MIAEIHLMPIFPSPGENCLKVKYANRKKHGIMGGNHCMSTSWSKLYLYEPIKLCTSTFPNLNSALIILILLSGAYITRTCLALLSSDVCCFCAGQGQNRGRRKRLQSTRGSLLSTNQWPERRNPKISNSAHIFVVLTCIRSLFDCCTTYVYSMIFTRCKFVTQL